MTKVGNRYTTLEQLGSGAMGVVWRAHDEVLQREVAVKQLLLPGLGAAEVDEACRRAMREARIAARLQHPNAIGVFDVVIEDGKPCLVMEYLPSRSLSAVLAEDGPLPPAEAARIGGRIAAALAAAHQAGVVHRDIKPGNVLIGHHGVVKITDFGISRAVGDVTVTRTGMLAGTLAYLAPELARGADPSPAADVFSLGATLYAVVEGTPPFGPSENDLGMLHRIASGRIVPPTRSGPLTPLLVRLLADDPSARPTAEAATWQLAELAGPTRTAPTPPGGNPAAMSPAPTPPSGTPPTAPGGTPQLRTSPTPPGDTSQARTSPTPPGGTPQLRTSPTPPGGNPPIRTSPTSTPSGGMPARTSPTPPASRPRTRAMPPAQPRQAPPPARTALAPVPTSGPPTAGSPPPTGNGRRWVVPAVAAAVAVAIATTVVILSLPDTDQRTAAGASDSARTSNPAVTSEAVPTSNATDVPYPNDPDDPTETAETTWTEEPEASPSTELPGTAEVSAFALHHFANLPQDPATARQNWAPENRPTEWDDDQFWGGYTSLEVVDGPEVTANGATYTVHVSLALTPSDGEPSTEDYVMVVIAREDRLLVVDLSAA
ncbi:protein kinase domain-containing protein [Saccharothrix hoggarensis]